jgi:hypothetical protein
MCMLLLEWNFVQNLGITMRLKSFQPQLRCLNRYLASLWLLALGHVGDGVDGFAHLQIRLEQKVVGSNPARV